MNTKEQATDLLVDILLDFTLNDIVSISRHGDSPVVTAILAHASEYLSGEVYGSSDNVLVIAKQLVRYHTELQNIMQLRLLSAMRVQFAMS